MGGGVAARVGEVNHGAGAHAFSRAEQGPPIVGSIFLGQKHFDLATAAGFVSPEAGGDDSGVVENEGVAGSDVGQEIGQAAVFPAGFAAVEDKEARGVARGGGLLGDQFRREQVIKVGGAQGFPESFTRAQRSRGFYAGELRACGPGFLAGEVEEEENPEFLSQGMEAKEWGGTGVSDS